MGLQSGALLQADTDVISAGSHCSDDESKSSSSGCGDGSHSTGSEVSEEGGDYAMATDDKLADLNVPMLDSDADKKQPLDEEIFSEDRDAAAGDKNATLGDGDSDVDSDTVDDADREDDDDSEDEDEEDGDKADIDQDEECLVMEIACQVAELLKERRAERRSSCGRGLGRRGVGMGSGDTDDEEEAI